VVPLGRRTRLPAAVAKAASAPDRVEHGGDDLETGLLALESGSAVAALESLRRAAFRDPSSAMAQFALARAYVAIGDRARALTALLHTRRLLAPLSSDEVVPGSDSHSVETLRQTVQTLLEDVVA
jgi:predicted Zn-dependent protease